MDMVSWYVIEQTSHYIDVTYSALLLLLLYR